ncbi:xaa-Pro aminopeptidase 1 [Nematostella vectensis]|nr:xaa-Pro aminopeptidase 1 [Nematostella vectensis]
MVLSHRYLIILGLTWILSEATEQKARVCENGKTKFLPGSAVPTSGRLQALRALMANKTITDGGVQAYMVPSSDAHQTEDVAPQHKRRQFISGFSGSHGMAIVTVASAALWTDGRYFLQAEMEMDCNWKLQKEGLPDTPKFSEWLAEKLQVGSRVGVDPFLLSICDWNKLSKNLKDMGIVLVPIKKNLIDLIWKEQPELFAVKPIYSLGLQFTGQPWQDKLRDLRLKMSKKSTTAIVLQALDEIAWIYNLRGGDISFSPVFFSYSVITQSSATLYIDNRKVTPDVREQLGADDCEAVSMCVKIKPYEAVLDDVEKEGLKPKANIWLTPYCNYALKMVIPLGKYTIVESPIALPKSIKNEVEIAGMKRANIRDAVVISEYLDWLEREVEKGNNNLTEITAEDQLLEFRKKQDNFISPSFATISGFGANSAIIHYKANEFTNTKITKDGLYLLDTGGQYLDGTTDTTRTVHFGTPTQHQIDCYTRVLMGHLDIAMAIFPNDTYGRALDIFAREPLWRVGLDYRHGTGHGIGHFLNVHEGPQCISPGFPSDEEKKLTKGMILSDEPGYYEDGQFGVRLESAVLVQSANTPYNFNGMDYLMFEPIIYVPFQRKLINVSLLRPSQIEWLNKYNLRTRVVIGKELRRQKKDQAWEWLMRETQPFV